MYRYRVKHIILTICCFIYLVVPSVSSQSSITVDVAQQIRSRLKSSDTDLFNRHKGYIDPHNHLSAVMHFTGFSLVLEEGFQLANSSLFSNPHSSWSGVVSFLANDSIAAPRPYEGTFAHRWKDNQTADVNGVDLPLYTWMSSGFIFGYDLSLLPNRFQQYSASSTDAFIEAFLKRRPELHSSTPNPSEYFYPSDCLSTVNASLVLDKVCYVHYWGREIESALVEARRLKERLMLKLAYILASASYVDYQRQYILHHLHTQFGTQLNLPLHECLVREMQALTEKIQAFEEDLKQTTKKPIQQLEEEQRQLEALHQQLYRMLENVLTASAVIDFSTALRVRTVLENHALLWSDKPHAFAAKRRMWRYTIQSLVDNNILYVELSIDMEMAQIMVQPAPNLTNDFSAARALAEICFSPAAVRAVKVRFLVFVASAALGAADPAPGRPPFAVWTQTPNGCQLASAIESIWNVTSFVRSIEQQEILSHEAFIGLGLPVTETSCYNYESSSTGQAQTNMNIMMDLLVRDGLKHKKKLLLHIHVGEGFPLYDYARIFGSTSFNSTTELFGSPNGFNLSDVPPSPGAKVTQSGTSWGMKLSLLDALCDNLSMSFATAKPMPILFDAPSGKGTAPLPKHATTARNNIDGCLELISNYKSSQSTLDRLHLSKSDLASVYDRSNALVSIRFGHATHATFQQGMTMATDNIDADINLASNFATMSYLWQPVLEPELGLTADFLSNEPVDSVAFQHKARLQAYTHLAHVLTDLEFQELPQLEHESTYIAHGLRFHGALPLILAGVRVLVGSDGCGIEHSALNVDYVAIRAVLQAFAERFDAIEHGQTVTPANGGDDAAIPNALMVDFYSLFSRIQAARSTNCHLDATQTQLCESLVSPAHANITEIYANAFSYIEWWSTDHPLIRSPTEGAVATSSDAGSSTTSGPTWDSTTSIVISIFVAILIISLVAYTIYRRSHPSERKYEQVLTETRSVNIFVK